MSALGASGKVTVHSRRTIGLEDLKLAILSGTNDGSQSGTYDNAVYGRTIYSAGIKGIYGTDKYDNAIYW